MNTRLILLVLLIGILVFSVAQAFEINNLKKTGSITGNSYGSSQQTSSASAPAQSPAPAMVGGC